jgi:anti-sigma B factor antagonist
VVRCQGRIVAGSEVNALQAELDKHTEIRKKVVLHLAEVDYIDSSGLGALVRAHGALRSSGGGLKLCQISPFVLQVLEVTKLGTVIPMHSTEADAIEAFDSGTHQEATDFSRNKIVCIDPSKDLLAYVRALLARSGYEVHTAWNLADGKNLVSAMKPRMLICGAGIAAMPLGAALIEKFKQGGPDAQVLHLPADFSTAEAGQAGTDLASQVKSLLG